MRLTHLKLAGFKSFVDPTTIQLSGQRVAIVGPNGCGKSNVMEAIRWVLGESSARELRGDSMQDVIFNGSLNRKAISRASVELHFDNSFGGAAGAWSQYSEIVVKRVLERDGNSSYIINNQQVRKRDITDLFLGTGVGSRAYAIIGQNTISRIVDAKPEELRVFLEEAAGVSRYKERRRETESRLKDTRENLLRVDDIRQEITKQILLLQSQAEIAQQYHQLKQQLESAHQLLWLLKKQQAANSWEKAKRQVEVLVNELEAEMATLRKLEANLERIRQQHITASNATQKAQTDFYEASAALTQIEQQLKHAKDISERAQMREKELSLQRLNIETQIRQRQSELQQHETLKQTAVKQGALMLAELEKSRKELPVHQSQQQAAQQALESTQLELAKTEQALQLSLANRQHQQQQLAALDARQQKLEATIAAMVRPDETELTNAQQAQEQEQQQLSALQAEIAQQQIQEEALQSQLQQQQQAVHEKARRIAQIEAELATLRKIQQSTGGDQSMSAWLSERRMDKQPRLWQGLRVNPAWEIALESVLGERLNAVLLETLSLAGKAGIPPASLVLCAPSGEASIKGNLINQIEILNPDLNGVLHDWLYGVDTSSSLNEALARQTGLKQGDVLVCPQGELVSRTSVKFYSKTEQLHGLLERQREVETLEAELPDIRNALNDEEKALQKLRNILENIRLSLNKNRNTQQSQAQKVQSLLLELEKLRQQDERVGEQLRLSNTALEDIGKQRVELAAQLKSAETSRTQQESEINQAKTLRDTKKQGVLTAEQALNVARERLRNAEHAAQEANYNERTINNKIIELNNSIKVFNEQNASLATQLQEAMQAQQSQSPDTLMASLDSALALRNEKEITLTEARNQMAELETRVRETEQSRMQSEHQLHPLRDKLEQARLNEQEARLYFEQCAAALSGVDEAALTSQLPKATSAASMERQAVALQEQITELGAVNLAAIEQLASENERANYLEAQALDLNQAIATLEDAIHRIDRETRGRLQHTFDEVNRNFGELFATLFNGGQARLELLGEEILDTGLQVFAQPPGKKTSTIHLLSGGEKALVALALVFALFRLNPAPFCLMDEVDAPLDDSNTERFCAMVKKMSENTQFVFITHNKIAMEMAQQLIGVTMQESGVSRVVEVDIAAAMQLTEEA
ncbi:MAG: chromosome segregation protein SMC [Methylophilales bacterium]|nr:chromosome segregation protein SMC [Methylophilales bacterium]